MMLLTLALLLPAQASGNDAFNSVAFRETFRPRTATRCSAKAKTTSEERATSANKCVRERRARAS